MYQLVITDDAASDIEGILDQTERVWGKQQRNKYDGLLVKSLQTITHSPHVGTPKYGVSEQYLGFSFGSHVIFYRISDRNVHVLRIIHASMNHADILH